MFSIRKFQDSDFSLIESWWKKNNQKIWRAILPDDTTFIVEYDGVPIISACLYLMNVPDACMMENLIGNPELSGDTRKEATALMFKFMEQEAKRRGYRTIVLFSGEEKLKRYYEGFGYLKTMDNVTTYAKSI